MNRLTLTRAQVTFLALLAIFLTWSLGVSAASQPEPVPPDQWAILLLNGTFTPTPGLDEATWSILEERLEKARAEDNGVVHVLLQLNHIPTTSEKADLMDYGIYLHTYVPNYAWIAAINDLEIALDAPGVRWIGDWSAEGKLDPYIRADSWGSWAIHPTITLSWSTWEPGGTRPKSAALSRPIPLYQTRPSRKVTIDIPIHEITLLIV